MFQNNILKKLNWGNSSLILGLISATPLLIMMLLPSLGSDNTSIEVAIMAFIIPPVLGASSIIFGLIAIFTNKGWGYGILGIILGMIGIIMATGSFMASTH